MQRLTVETRQGRQVVDITGQLERLIGQNGMQRGLCSATILHTTAALTTADLDPGTDLDMLDAFSGMLPDIRYRHPHNPAHTPDHILASLLGPTVTLPVELGPAGAGHVAARRPVRVQRAALAQHRGDVYPRAVASHPAANLHACERGLPAC